MDRWMVMDGWVTDGDEREYKRVFHACLGSLSCLMIMIEPNSALEKSTKP